MSGREPDATKALWRVIVDGRPRWARGEPGSGPDELLGEDFDLDAILAGPRDGLRRALREAPGEALPEPPPILAPVQGQDVWASGVTFERSRMARNEEAGNPDYYDRVYAADRPELFFKAGRGTVRGPGDTIGIRSDSGWDVPEPELALILSGQGHLVACSIGNDVSSRAIEGDNPLYLPQAKVYRGSCALGPCLVPVEDLPPLQELTIAMTVQRGAAVVFSSEVSVAQMRRTPAELADWLYRGLDFPAGVVLLTGTALVPPSTLLPGDMVTVGITGLGELTNTVELIDAGPRRGVAGTAA